MPRTSQSIGEYSRPAIYVMLPVCGIEKLDRIAVPFPVDGVEIVILTAIAVTVGGGSCEPHAGIEVIQLAVGIGEVRVSTSSIFAKAVFQLSVWIYARSFSSPC